MPVELLIDNRDIEFAMKRSVRNELPLHGREPAICELTCDNCGTGMRFDQDDCLVCGLTSTRAMFSGPCHNRAKV